MKITFTDTMGVSKKYYPEPASKHIPEWYADMKSYIDDKKMPNGQGTTTATIKKCMPVFDSMSAGYIIFTPCDVWIKQESLNQEDNSIADDFIKKNNLTGKGIKLETNLKQPHYEWPRFNAIQFHPIQQAPKHPNNTGHLFSYPKWMNPWSIKTPSGYSVAFVQPWHRDSIFTILPAIVDTDKYISPVNFPFILNNIDFEGLIPAGTPMAQVIPFKRDSWQMEIGKQKDLEDQNETSNLLNSKFFDGYKNFFRQKKEYK